MAAGAIGNSAVQPVIVKNPPRSGGVLALDQRKHLAPDGFPNIAVNTGIHIARQFMKKEMRFNPQRDLTPVTLFLRIYFMMIASLVVAPGTLMGRHQA